MVSLPARARRLAAVAGALTALAAGAAEAGQAPARPALKPTMLCRAGEQPLFACPLARKLVAVCAGPRGAAYRYGLPNRVELESGGLTLAERAYAGGGETQVSFARAGYTYVVFDRTRRTGFGANGNDPQSDSGLAVVKAGRTVRASACLTDATVAPAARRRIPAGPFTEH